MQTWRKRFKIKTVSMTLLRVTVGFIMATHGWLKLTDISGTREAFAGMGIPAPELSAYLAVAGELAGGLGLLLGLLTPIASFGILCVMATAIVLVHWGQGLLAQQGGWEYPLTILMVALYFITRGAGPFSLDAWLAKRHEGEERRFHIPGQKPKQVSV